jgi:hypothetical protein
MGKKDTTTHKEIPAVDLISKFKNAKDDINVLRDIKTLILTGTLKWVDDFVKNDGKQIFMETLAVSNYFKIEDKKKATLISETLLALRGLCNTDIGMNDFKNDKDALKILILFLDTPTNSAKETVTFLVAQFCTIQDNNYDGFGLVLDAMNYFKKIKNEKFRFETLVKNIKENKVANIKFDSCCLVNGLISGSESEVHRLRIQKEFLYLGNNFK